MTGGNSSSGGRRIGRALVWPVRRLLDPRFADVNRRVEYSRNLLEAREQATRDELGDAARRIEALIATYSKASDESLTFIGTQLQALEHAISEGDAARADQVRALNEQVGELGYGRRISALIGAQVEDLDAETSQLLNYAASHDGFLAQRGLWLNPPITVAYRPGDVVAGDVNERIVELPYAMRALGRLEPPGEVLDVGSVESAVPLQLASLGYKTCALDLRAYPFAHPNLEVVESRLEDWEREPQSFDAILCISTVEHVGLGWYGEPEGTPDADVEFVARLGELLRPDGFLVLTVPYGQAHVDSVQRTYDAEGLERLLHGWRIADRTIVSQRDERTWAPGEPEDPRRRGVAMAVARPPE